MANLVGIRECARILEQRGVSLNASTISRQVTAGIIPNHGTQDGKVLVDPDEVIAARSRNLDQAKQRGPSSPLFGGGEPRGDDAGAAGELAAGMMPADKTTAGEAGTGGGKRGVSFSDARTASEAYKARMAQLDLEERLGNLLDTQEVINFFTEAGILLRQGLALRAGDLAARLIGRTDPNEIAAIVNEEDRKVLERLAREFTNRFVKSAAEEVQDAAA